MWKASAENSILGAFPFCTDVPAEEEARTDFIASSPVSILTSVTPGREEEEGKILLGPARGLTGLPTGSEAATNAVVSSCDTNQKLIS